MKIGCKIIFLVLLIIIGYFFFIIPILEANAELDIFYTQIKLSKNPIKEKSRYLGSTRETEYIVLRAKEYPTLKFISSNQSAFLILTELSKGMVVQIGVEKEDLDYRKNVFRNDSDEMIVRVYDLIHFVNEKPRIYINRQTEDQRRLGWRKFTIPFYLLFSGLISIVFFLEK